jgi:hypothetical protein
VVEWCIGTGNPFLRTGYLAAWGFVRYNCGPAGYDDECAAIAGMVGVAFLPAGTLVGFLIDRTVGNDLVYIGTRQAAHPAFGISPLLGKGKTGLSVSLRY